MDNLSQHELITETILYEVCLRNKGNKANIPLLLSKKNVDEMKMTKTNNMGFDSKQVGQNIQLEVIKKLVYDDQNGISKMNSQYINLDKEMTMLKKDFMDNYESEIKEDNAIENLSNTGKKKNPKEMNERIRESSPDYSKSIKNQKNNPKIKIIIEEKNVLKQEIDRMNSTTVMNLPRDVSNREVNKTIVLDGVIND
jgi:hypothetical protein